MPSSAIEEIRHRIAIAGSVVDAITRQGIDNAVVEVAGQELSTQTRADGSFYFLDLPLGAYTLNISAPQLGSRYGTVSVANIAVQNAEDGRPVFDPKANVQLPPTRLEGQVNRSETPEQPIAQATVRLRGSDSQTLTDKNGRYTLSGLQVGQPTAQVVLKGIVVAMQTVTLKAGQSTAADFGVTIS